MTDLTIRFRMKFDGVWRTPVVALYPIGVGAPVGGYPLKPTSFYLPGRTIDWEGSIPAALKTATQWRLDETVDVRGWVFWRPNPITTHRELDDVAFSASPGTGIDVPLD